MGAIGTMILATAIAGGVAAFVLENINYVPNVEQTKLAKDVFHGCMSIGPAVLYLCGFLFLFAYPLTKEKYYEIEQHLRERRMHA